MAINTRSPYYVSTSISNTAYTTLDIYIWEGSVTSTTTPKYILKKYAISGSTWVSYEISELVRDYIDTIFDGDYNGQSVWYKSTIKVYNTSNVLIAHNGLSKTISESNHAMAPQSDGRSFSTAKFIRFSLCHNTAFVRNCKCLGFLLSVTLNS